MLNKLTMGVLLACILIIGYAITREVPSKSEQEIVHIQRGSDPEIDKFIGYWDETESQVMYGTLEVWDLLTKCYDNPLHPSVKGAVLTAINACSYAKLDINKETTPTTLVDRQLILYVISGIGTITSNGENAELRSGIGVIIPPGIRFTMSNNGPGELYLYIVEEPIPRDFKPRSNMVVKDENNLPVSTNINRSDSDGWLFSRNDGLSTLVAMNPVTYIPRSLIPPHIHDKETEEVWFAISGDIFIQIGRQRRKFPIGSAYKVPSDGRTPHSNINATQSPQKLMWMMKVPVQETAPAEQKRRSMNGLI
ncbi:MAG: hypothetical protein JXB48_13430 [Candidatus Latescibacteria bacterium]|nr:hypothetical protein [Candidatus Latescibacterota bacterium]